ncbi:MAG: RNA polymerase sigma factor [Rubripirellula sp.]
MTEKNDEPDTISDATAGEMLAVEFDRAHQELIGTLYFVVGSSDDARDVLQDTFLKCWRNRASLSKITNLRAWIFRIAVNTARDYRKSAWSRKRRMLPEEMPMIAPSRSPERELIEDEQRQQLQRAVMQLRPEEQEVFLLRQKGELTYELIADVISVPVGTVKTRMRSAIRQLRESVGDVQ